MTKKMKKATKTMKLKKRAATGGEIVDCNGSRKKQQQHQQHEGGPVLPDELVVFEVLSRVKTVKRLHQYRCVSKAWRSITAAPHFSKVYPSHNRGGVLMSIAEHFGKKESAGVFTGPVEVRFLYSSLLQPQQELKVAQFFCRMRLKLPASRYFREFSPVINGLACVYEANRVMVCNVCTGQTMSLPDNEFERDRAWCFLGYDPVSRVYKLLKLSVTKPVRTVLEEAPVDVPDSPPGCRFDSRVESEILTLGRDSSWRKLDCSVQVVTFELYITFHPESFVLINGIMYWLIESHHDPLILFSFDLNEEKLQLIDTPPLDFGLRHPFWLLVNFRGRPALFSRDFPDDLTSIKFDVLEDVEGNCWSRHSISLSSPGFEFGGLPRVWALYPIGNLPTGQILFAIHTNPVEESECFTHVYSYDHQKNMFERLLVGPKLFSNWGSHPNIFPTRITYLEENVAPLEVLFSGGEL